ncbi:HlyD family type I secretion periplasmic adaptor subunit [Lacibacterium aquatile]|uniref:Membrane fusion protein (MFP) family protein n=1 Tax=Lacibacterium aquatile TaxID=1168082 RepID=A0ABW5DWC7_9PROT
MTNIETTASDRSIAAFKPGLLAILETPPSPTARLTTLLLCSAIVAAGTWGWFGKMDVVASATGQIVPTGQIKQVQASEPAVVKAIHVTEGQRVKAGDLLVEFDPTPAEADLEAAETESHLAALDIARLTALIEKPEAPDAAFIPPAGTAPAAEILQRSLIRARAAEQIAKRRNAEAEIAKRSAEASAYGAEATKIEAILPLLERRVSARRTLLDRQAGSEMAFLELQQQQIEQAREVPVRRQRQREAEANADAARATLAQVEAEYERSLNTELAEALRKRQAADLAATKARRRLDLTRLTAPVDGTVQQLVLATVGGVVTAAQPLMALIPSGTALEVRAQLPNKDIGFVKAGQPVKVKIESFTFTKYGLLTGTVTGLSADAVKDEKQGLVYTARIALDSDRMTIDGQSQRLTPGMAVTAEIVTGERRLIEYVLTPVLRAVNEAGRER